MQILVEEGSAGLLGGLSRSRSGGTRAGTQGWVPRGQQARWSNANELKRKYSSASIMKKGAWCSHLRSKFRLIVGIELLREGRVHQWLGTHTEYDDIDAEEV